MRRMVDEEYGAYGAHTAVKSELNVKCPKCGGFGIVTAGDGFVCLKCTNCGSVEKKVCMTYQYEVSNRCEKCGHYYKVIISDKKRQGFSKLNIPCPDCGYVMPGEVSKKAYALPCYQAIENACDPFFGCELWFLTYFKNKPVWAVNRDHLNYLIRYLSADLREKPVGYPFKKQADHLPSFMKSAKNRERIVRLLMKMQMEF